MRYFLTRIFLKHMESYDFAEDNIHEVIKDINEGRGVSLGRHLYKIRASAEGHGKSGGFRIVFFWKREKHIVFCRIFSKSEMDNLSFHELKVLNVLSQEYINFTEVDIQNMIDNGKFKEVI